MRQRRNTHNPRGELSSYKLQRQFRDRADHGETDVPERGVLVSVLLPHTRADLRDPLGELQALAESAGVEVVADLIQKRTAMTPALGIGKGKLEELGELVTAYEADVVIFDNELSPRQIRGLERALECKVIDRSELILDIFASRARTKEAQLQVELAQLEYTAPRLRGMWTHLERIAGAGGATAAGSVGGVGTRGPGERQIEIDRRIVKQRISFLRGEINKIDERKKREVAARTDQFTIALVGYTNSGKSTLMKRLTGTDRYIADQLFATLDTRTARWSLGEGKTVLLSDTVGFVRDLPHHLVASFRATLEEAIHADLLLHVADISAPNAPAQVRAVEEVLKAIECDHIPRFTVLNKVDIANDAALVEMRAGQRQSTIAISALSGEGIDILTEEVGRRMLEDTVEVTVLVPHAAGKLLAELEHLADIRERRYVEGGVELSIRMNRAPFNQLRGRHQELAIVGGQVDVHQGDGPDAFL